MRGWQSTDGTLPSYPMPPFTRNHSVRRRTVGAPGGFALTTRAWANKSIDTDVLSAGFASLLAAGHLQR